MRRVSQLFLWDQSFVGWKRLPRCVSASESSLGKNRWQTSSFGTVGASWNPKNVGLDDVCFPFFNWEDFQAPSFFFWGGDNPWNNFKDYLSLGQSVGGSDLKQKKIKFSLKLDTLPKTNIAPEN